MPNKVKYNPDGTENAIFKGNWAIDTSPPNSGGGPSSVTGFYNGADAPEGGYVIYEEGAVRTIADDTELVNYINSKGGGDTFESAVEWIQSQGELALVTPNSIKPITTEGIIFNIDPSISMIANNTGKFNSSVSLLNGPVYSNEHSRSIEFDGTNDILRIDSAHPGMEDWTLEFMIDVHNLNADSQGGYTIFSHSTRNKLGYDEGSIAHVLDYYNGRNDGLYIDSNDNIYVTGFFGGYQSHLSSSLVKIGSNGTVDTNFLWHVRANTNRSIRRVQQYGNGDLLVYGRFLSSYGIQRANSSTGQSITDPPSTNGSQNNGDCLLYDDNTVFAVGGLASIYNNQTIKGIVKVDGTNFLPISGFDTSTGFDADLDSPNTIAKCSDGAIIVGGSFTEYKGTSVGRIVKINSTTGAIDTSFSQGTGFDGTVTDILSDGNGNLAVRGSFNNYNGTSCPRLVMLDESGSVVNTYPSFNNWIYAMEFQDDGKLIVGGPFTQLDESSTRRYICRLNTDGTLDTTFGSQTNYFNGIVTGIKKQSNGKLIVVGDFNSHSSNQFGLGIARLNTNGTYDNTFNIGDGFNRSLYRANTNIRGSQGYRFMGIGNFGQPGGEVLWEDGAIFWSDKIHHLVVTFDSETGTFKFYRNGRLRKIIEYSGWTQTLVPADFYFSDRLLKMRIYDRPISLNEIRKNLYQYDIVLEGLMSHLDSQNIISKPGSQNIWWDIAGQYNSNNTSSTDADVVLYNGASLSNGAIIMDGVDDYGYVSSGPNITIKNSTFTITFDDTDQGVYGRLFWVATVFGFIWRRENSTYVRINNITQSNFDLGELPLGKKQLTVTIDENYQSNFYIDGEWRAIGDFSGYHIDYTWNYYWDIGRNPAGDQSSRFDYYSIMVYDRVLSSSEVLQNYNAQKDRFGL